MSCRSFSLSSFFLLLLGPALLLADIHGVVMDPSGAPVPGAVVYLLPGVARAATADAAGRYRFAAAPPGSYTLVAGAPGLAGRPAEVRYTGGDVTVNLPLELAARSETVVVTAERADMPAAAVASSTTVLARRDLEEVGAANLVEALRYVPGLAVSQTGRWGRIASLFARGANSNMNLVLVDGVAVNDFGGFYDF